MQILQKSAEILDFYRNLQKGVPFCRFYRNLKFLQKSKLSLKATVGAEFVIWLKSLVLRLSKGAHFLQISEEI